MKNILCFGDSNTHGAASEYEGRYPFEKRWTNILGSMLGSGYNIIEEGLGGRTSAFTDPFNGGKNGLEDLPMLLMTHNPLDLITIMLGTNDTKQIYNASPKSIAYGVEKLIDEVRKSECRDAKIIVISPIIIGKNIDNSRHRSCDYSAHLKSLELAEHMKVTADLTGSAFFDAATVAHAGSDCLHLTEDSHKALAEALFPIVKELIG